jgi:hypothetical protein
MHRTASMFCLGLLVIVLSGWQPQIPPVSPAPGAGEGTVGAKSFLPAMLSVDRPTAAST